MTKPFKLQIHLPKPFQFCRSIASAVLANSKQSSIPANPEAFHAAYLRSPGPPPSSPNQPSYKFLFEKLYNTPDISAEFEVKTAENGDSEEASSSTESASLTDGGWFSSEEEDGDNDDGNGSGSECLLSSSSSFSSSSEKGRKIMKKEVRRMKSINLNNWKEGERKKQMLPERDSLGRKLVLGSLLPCVMDGMVQESYAILKKSSDPFDDFKMSMVEMIQEKQISEPDDLENLLMCFLSLNAKGHHAVIVAAFTEVWEELHLSKS